MPFAYRLELEDGTPADPPTLTSAVPNWRPGDTIPLGRKTLRVVAVRPAEVLDGDPVHVDCDNYVLGGVGNTNATVSLVATYSATIDCTNKGGNLVESHTSLFSDSSTATVASTRNGQLRVPAQSASAFGAPQVCPNPNWTPSIREGTLVLESFTYTLTFAGFSAPAVLITASDP
jgi:hypothetical protein